MQNDASVAAPTTGEVISAGAGDTVSALMSCSAQSWPGIGGRVLVLRVVGEIDHLTCPMLRTALEAGVFGARDQVTSRLVVDLAGVTFCGVRGFALLADMAATAAANGTGYAVSGCNRHLERCWRILETDHHWAEIGTVARYLSTASAVIALAEHPSSA